MQNWSKDFDFKLKVISESKIGFYAGEKGSFSLARPYGKTIQEKESGDWRGFRESRRCKHHCPTTALLVEP
jgi:hypothetical protein